MKKLKYAASIFLAVLAISMAFSFVWQNKLPENTTSDAYTIENKWQLPSELNEVSGIAWVSENEIAAVQDEDGVIFIYNLKKQKITDRIQFAGAGDYEGIALRGKDAYILRSDGLIYEVINFRLGGNKISTFQTNFSEDDNIETLELDAKKNTLIIVPKDRDKSDDFKGLYHIPLGSKSINAEPMIKIKMNDGAFKNFRKKKAYKTFNPSDLAIHPKTDDYYIIEGKNPALVILYKDGTIKKVYTLDKATFAQPEGITFSPDGTLYISNEAGDDAANILQVRFK